jgi:hypothetical protein
VVEQVAPEERGSGRRRDHSRRFETFFGKLSTIGIPSVKMSVAAGSVEP